MPDKILISITDDQTLFREGLINLLNQQNNIEVLHETENGKDLLIAFERAKPDVALIDMDMPEMNGMELNKKIQQDYPEVKVIILSVHNHPSIIAQMIQAGADAYLEKNCGLKELTHTIAKVHENGFYINRQVMEAIQLTSEIRQKAIQNLNQLNLQLTEREQQVLNMICRELSTQEMSERLFISPRTVEGHRQNLLLKTGCRNTAGLVLFAIRNNMFSIDENKFER